MAPGGDTQEVFREELFGLAEWAVLLLPVCFAATAAIDLVRGVWGTTQWLGLGLLLVVAAVVGDAAYGRRWGIIADERGLTEQFRLRPDRFFRWQVIRQVMVEGHFATVITMRGELVLDAHMPGRQRLVELIRQRIQANATPAPASDEAPAVDLADLRDWLGLEPGGGLSLDGPRQRWRPVLLGLVPALIGIVVATAAGLPAHQQFPVTLGLSLYGVTLARLADRRRPRVRADERGLLVEAGGRRRFVPWSCLRGLERQGARWLVHTTDDHFAFEAKGAAALRLATCLKQVLAAREAGRELPRLTGLPDGALSSAAPPTATTTGLSRPVPAAMAGQPTPDGEDPADEGTSDAGGASG